MANYNIVIGSKFRPFSYAEMLAPVAQSTEAHQKVEEGYANLSAQADMIAGLAAMEPDSEAARRYKAYSDSLYEKADRLARNGLTPQDRSDMLSMYSRYAKEIKPIGDAITARQQDITRQDALYDKGNGRIRFDRDARDVSIDEYLDGKRPKYTSLNLDSIRQEVAANTQAWSKRYFSTEEGQRFNGEYYKLVQNQGISPDRAQAILLGHLDQYPELQKLIASEKGMVNYSGFSKNTQAEVDNAITQGLNVGMFYDRKETNLENWKYKADLAFERQLQRDAIQQQYALDQAAAANGGGTDVFDPRTPIDTEEVGIGIDEQAKKTVKSLDDGLNILGIKKDKRGNNIQYSTITIPAPANEGYWRSKTKDDAVTFNSKYGKNYSYDTMKKYVVRDHTHRAQDLTNNSGGKEFRVFDSKGNLLTKQQFANQSKDNRAYLEAYYEKFIEPASTVLGKAKNVTSAYRTYTTSKAKASQGIVSGIPINIKGGNPDELKKGNLGRLISQSGGIYRVDGAIENYAKGKRVSANDIYKDLDKIDGEPYVSYHVITVNGRNGQPVDGILISSGDKRYFLPAEQLSGAGRDGFNKLRATQQRKRQRDEYINRYKSKYGDYWQDAYAADTDMQGMEAGIKASGTEALQDIVRSMTGNLYNAPDFDVINQSFSDN